MTRRIEFIGNLSLEEDIFELLEQSGLGRAFTYVQPVHGNGESGPCFGDAVWPEENFYLLIFLPERDVELVRTLVSAVRTRHPGVGISCFISDVSVEQI